MCGDKRRLWLEGDLGDYLICSNCWGKDKRVKIEDGWIVARFGGLRIYNRLIGGVVEGCHLVDLRPDWGE